MKCENCNNEHSGQYGSGRFCSSRCARSFSTSKARKEINQKVSQKLSGISMSIDERKKRSFTHTDKAKDAIKRAVQLRWSKIPKITIEQNRARVLSNTQAYYARKSNAISPSTDLKLIQKIYENCPLNYQVDHILSLKSGGMHHQDNLQYLPNSENARKGNGRKYDHSLAIKWQDFWDCNSTGE